MLTMHDATIALATLGFAGVFLGAWIWVWDKFSDIPTEFRDDTHDFWGL
jgi:hypothetical protein